MIFVVEKMHFPATLVHIHTYYVGSCSRQFSVFMAINERKENLKFPISRCVTRVKCTQILYAAHLYFYSGANFLIMLNFFCWFYTECGKCKSGTKRLNLNKFCKRDYGK